MINPIHKAMSHMSDDELFIFVMCISAIVIYLAILKVSPDFQKWNNKENDNNNKFSK